MKIRDERSYLVIAHASGADPVTLHLLDTAGKTVRSVNVPAIGSASVTVPVGQTVEFTSDGGQKPTKATVNGADATTAALTGIGNGGYILTSHPRAGDIVVFTH